MTEQIIEAEVVEAKPESRKAGRQDRSKKTITQKNDSKESFDISTFVTNPEGNVYAIKNLPEEFIATLFAWVSRSPKSFKTHLEEAVKQFGLQPASADQHGLDEKARSFHEKWTVGYGHSSVAEHATAHVGIEAVSRLASAELELSNTFLSITEYSQRYQKPERGKWHNPVDPDSEVVRANVEDFFHKSFDVFEKLIDGVYTDLKKKFVHSPDYDAIKDDTKAVDRKLNDLLKLAFEDARYVLPLAMHTQLGMTANGRAWRDSLANLANSDHPESQKLSADIKEEVTKVLPVLLKYATPSQYQKNSKIRLKNNMSPHSLAHRVKVPAKLGPVEHEETVIDRLFSLLYMQEHNVPLDAAHFFSIKFAKEEDKRQLIKDLIFEMKHFDAAPAVFNHVRYTADLYVSEANWHQLLRHNRKTDFTFSNPSPAFGYKVPPRIKEAGLTHLLDAIAMDSLNLYNKLVLKGFTKEAEYVVLNTHYRAVHADFSLTEAYHLINLRTSEEAQWDIRETFESLYEQLKVVHPLLISQAKRRD